MNNTDTHKLEQQIPDAWPVETHPEHYLCTCGSRLWIDVTQPVCLTSQQTVTR